MTEAERRMPPTPRPRWAWALWLSGPLAWAVVELSGTLPGFTSRRLALLVSNPLVAGLDEVSGRFSFSLSEIFLLLLILAVAGLVGRRLRQRDRTWPRRGLALLLDLLLIASPLIAVFELSWATHFERSPLAERLKMTPVEATRVEDELRALASPLVNATNQAYLALHGTEDRERPTAVEDRARLDDALERSWRRLARGLAGAELAEGTRGPVKPLRLSPLFRRMGISGVFSPFTAEAHFVTSLPGCQLPMVLAHEKAHQRGVAPEDEANYLGFLAALDSGEPVARYAALLFAQRQVLGTLAHLDGSGTASWLEERLPGVQRDVDDRVEYWSRYRGRTRRFARAMNDRYLKAHGVHGGVLSYARSLDLLLRDRGRWARGLPDLDTLEEPVRE